MDHAERQKVRDEERYGHVSERNTGRLNLSKPLMIKLLCNLPLPRMTRVVDIVPTIDGDVDLIVESPDIPALTEDDQQLPPMILEATMHYMSKDHATPCLSIIEYVAVSAWAGKPDTKEVTPLFGSTLTAKTRKRLLEMTESEKPSGDSLAFAALRELGWTETNFEFWADAVASLDEAQVRKLCAIMLESFWGKLT